MQVRRSDTGLEVWAPAKLNLFLEVLSKRPDGFHEIETLMCPISLYDTLFFRPDHSGRVMFTAQTLQEQTRRSAAEQLPAGSENIVVRAVELLRSQAPASSGARVHLLKRIPIAAGLAGGSSDAAAALVAANLGWRLGLSTASLMELAATLGSDVPFFLERGAAICRGRGERIERLPGLPMMHLVVVRPPEGLSTADVYRACRPAQAPKRADSLVSALRRGETGKMDRFLHNALEPAAARLSPWIGRLKERFARFDLAGHQMSGSGTSYFGICRHERHARRLAAQLRAERAGRVFNVRTGDL
jgi:4-diphosphocytidyl-2-C-methyl-D-erythritol kinase